ncbi:MAG: hypothetical protein NTV93_05055 [Verrucomicrobia bacterium]|nr:hypothetical protein [Verrucomicrobiota bacterium]
MAWPRHEGGGNTHSGVADASHRPPGCLRQAVSCHPAFSTLARLFLIISQVLRVILLEKENILRTLEEISANKPLELPAESVGVWEAGLKATDAGYAKAEAAAAKKTGAFGCAREAGFGIAAGVGFGIF